MTATPPRADLRTLAAEAAFRFDKRAGFVTRDDMPSHYLDLADAVLAAVLPEHRRTVLEADRPQPCPLDHSCDDGEMCSCWCDLHDYPIAECPTFTLVERWIADMRTEHEAVVARLRRTVLTEAAGAIIRDALCNEGTPYDTLGGAVAVVRRLAAAAPPAGLSATVPAQNAPPVPEEADGQRAPGGPYRVGRHVGRTIYAQLYADGPSDEDVLIGVMDTRELAASVVRGMNASADVAAALTVAERAVIEAARAWAADGWNTQAGPRAQHLLATVNTLDALPEDTPGGFHEPDEPTDHIQAAFDGGTHGRTAPARGQTRRLDVRRPAPPDPIDMVTYDEMESERDRLAVQVAEYQRVVERVRALHLFGGTAPLAAYDECRECVSPWPCPTIAAVDALPDAGTDQTEDDHG